MDTTNPPHAVAARRLLLVFAALVLASASLYWSFGVRDNIYIIFGVGPISALIAVVGASVLPVVLYTQWLPRRGDWATAGVVMWVLAPVVAGPVFALVFVAQLERYYQSTAYASWYAAWSGITIAPQAQSFHYTDCRLDGYTATYQITAQRDTELSFALLDRNGLRAEDAGDGPERSIGDQLDEDWRKVYRHVEDGEQVGIYRVPAGNHTLVVEAGSPFQLSILDTHPLWTPDGWLSPEDRYYAIYSDDHSWEEIVLAEGQAHIADCPRLDLLTTQVLYTTTQPDAQAAAQSAARFLAFDAFSIEWHDADNNDRLERLVIHASLAAIDRETQDWYDWTASLLAPDGTVIETVGGMSQLNRGRTITFDFSGAAIAGAGFDGPYTLGNFTFAPSAAPTQTVTLPALYTVTGLQASNFEP